MFLDTFGLSNVVSLIGGGLIVYALERWTKRGKIIVDSYYVEISYQTVQSGDAIRSIDLDMQFVNRSGDDKLINQLSAHLITNNQKIPLGFAQHTVPPAQMIKARAAECLRFQLVLLEQKHRFGLQDQVSLNTIQLEIMYNIGTSSRKFVITDLHLKQWEMPLVI